MAKSIPVGHYSQLGEQTINRMSKDDVEYINFLKYFGRVFKHPVSVALEFYVNKPEAQFIASVNQWKRAGYQVNPASTGIQFLDQKGNEVTLYDFEDVIGDYPPKRWTITNRNVDAIRNELGLPKDTPLFSALDESAASAIDDLSLIQDLELTDLSNEDKLKFRNSYHNMIQTMIAGRLEINGARYNVQPDRAALEFCKSDEQKLMLLTSASSAARKALTSVEYAFDTLRTENNLRKEEQNNAIRTVENSQRRGENTSTRSGISADTERTVGERTDRVSSGEEGRTAGLDNSSESRRSGESTMDSGDNDKNNNIGRSIDTAAVYAEPIERTVYPDDTERTVNDGRTGGTVRQNVDGEHGEELPGEGRANDVSSQLPDGSSFSGQESGGILRTAERTIRQEQSTSDNWIRSSAAVVENEEIRNRQLGNDGDSSRPGNNSLNHDEKQLENVITKQSYAEYRASLKDTRFTKLSEVQAFNFSHAKYVNEPETSIWGEVQSSFRINNGIFEVSTASHGGIMIKSDIARIILSKEAQNTAQKERGWYYFEEDCDYAVAKRELIDKGLFDNIDSYFSRQYNKKTDEFFPIYSNSLNESLQRWHSKYYDSREVALFNALSPEEQAEEIGQLSFSDNISDEAETTEIRNHAIETTMDDIRKRIERIEAANGDPNELATQVNMLNFLQAAAEQGIEITSDNFKSFVAENSVAISNNVPENYFEIYQLKSGEALHYHRFTDYETLHKEGNAVEAKNYDLVYREELSSGTTLENIYSRFNIAHPDDFKGHSLSVSDVIVVHDNGETAAYYIDSDRYIRVPEFLNPEQTAENVDTNSNEEASVVTSSNDNEKAIHDGFAAIYEKHNYSPKQKQFLERLEKFAVRENVTENIIDTAFERNAAFHNTYGSREYVSRNIFGRRLGSTERELAAAISAAMNDNVAEQNESSALNKAKELINDFCEHEYLSSADFNDLHNVSLAYTTLTEHELPVQVTADLIDFKIIYEFNGEVYDNEKFNDLDDMVNNGLTGISFDELVSVPDDVIEQHTQELESSAERNKDTYMLLSRCSRDCEYVINNSDMMDKLESINKHLYGGSIESCISTMREQYNKLSDDDKPEWLSAEDIDGYEKQLNDIITQIRANEAKTEPQVLVSAEINGEINYYKLSGVSQEDIMNIANAKAPLLGYENIGTRISEVEYAEIEQSSDLSFSVELDFDNDAATIYRVNGGQGGISEGDRNDDNISFENIKISEYRLPYTGLGAEKITINAEDAISMWNNGFTVYLDDKAIPKRSELPDGTDVVELFSDDKVFTAAFGDVKQQNMIDTICDNIHDLDAVMDEDRYIDIRGFIDTDEDNAFEWNDNLNVYQNVEKALVERNYGFIDEYLTFTTL